MSLSPGHFAAESCHTWLLGPSGTEALLVQNTCLNCQPPGLVWPGLSLPSCVSWFHSITCTSVGLPIPGGLDRSALLVLAQATAPRLLLRDNADNAQLG